MIRSICLALIVALMIGCGRDLARQLACHDQVVRQGVETLTLPQEVEAQFGAENVDNFISNFESNSLVPLWNTVTYFYSRYRLTVQFTVSINYNDCQLEGITGSPLIQINEVTDIHFTELGRASARLKGQWRLSESEWKQVVDSGGDWSVVDVPLRTDAPVEGFDEYVRQWREPRNNRKGLMKPTGNGEEAP